MIGLLFGVGVLAVLCSVGLGMALLLVNGEYGLFCIFGLCIGYFAVAAGIILWAEKRN